MMRRVYLDVYSKSGRTNILQPWVYADPDKNTKAVVSPSLTLVGESTPEALYDGISRQDVAHGLIPRFIVVEYQGHRPPGNPNAGAGPPSSMAQRFADLAECALRMSANNSFLDVALSPDAKIVLDELDVDCDDRINAGGDDVVRQLWNRAHLNALKVAANLAVVNNPERPVVSREDAEWARIVRFQKLTHNPLLLAAGFADRHPSRPLSRYEILW